MYIYDKDALQKITDKILHDISHADVELRTDKPIDPEPLQVAQEDLLQRRERLLDALEQGILGPLDYADRVNPINAQLDSLSKRIQEIENNKEILEARHSSLSALAEALDKVPLFITKGPRQTVHLALSKLIDYIIVGEDGELEIIYL